MKKQYRSSLMASIHETADGLHAAGIMDKRTMRESDGLCKGPLFRGTCGRKGDLGSEPLGQSEVYRLVRRREEIAGIATGLGCHAIRATGITAYLKDAWRLEIAHRIAGHESARTTRLYDWRGDEIALNEVGRIGIR